MKKKKIRGTWKAQLVKHLVFGSGNDPRVPGSSPTLGSLLGEKSAASPAPHPCAL